MISITGTVPFLYPSCTQFTMDMRLVRLRSIDNLWFCSMQTELDRKHSIGITNNIIDCYFLRADREHATQVLICVVSTQYTEWSPSIPVTLGTRKDHPDYRGILISGVKDVMYYYDRPTLLKRERN